MCRGIIICLMLLAVSGAKFVGASNADDSCYAHSTGYVSLPSPNPIKSIPADSGESLGYIAWRTSFDIIESRKDSTGNCWLRIDRGWIRDDHVQPNKSRQSTRTNTTSRSQTKCYSASKVYITGAMNIRSGPGTGNRKVGSAQAGESFSVSRSQRGGDYCWLKVSKGWIAKTGRVSTTKPVVRTTSSSIRNTVPCPMPPVHGSAELKDAVQKAANVLGRHPSWCNYVTSARPASISELTYGGCGMLKSNERQIRIYLSQRLCRSNDAYMVAETMVHEACHLHQLNAGNRLLNPFEIEPPCYQKAIDFLIDVAPGRYGDVISQFRDKIRQYGG